MWKRKRLILVVVLGVVVLAGSIAGVAFAQTGQAAAASANNTLLDRVAAILKIEPQTLKNAFTQAQQEQRDAALDKYLANLVTQGKITQKQADDYKAWLKARPDIQLPGGKIGPRFDGRGGMMGRRGGMMGGQFMPRFQGKPVPTVPGTTPQ